jgi:small subunit ribosomal protein S11
MGKKRIVKKGNSSVDTGSKDRSISRLSKKRLESGVLHVQSTYNNTKLVLTDQKGGVICNSSSGSLGFKGSKKSTPFAAAKAGEVMAEKADVLGLKTVDVIVNGVGMGRESAIRAFTNRGVGINSIQDKTPIPHNGVTKRRTRRV